MSNILITYKLNTGMPLMWTPCTLPSERQQTMRSPLFDDAKQSISDEKLKNLQSFEDLSSSITRLLSTVIRILLFCIAALTRGFSRLWKDHGSTLTITVTKDIRENLKIFYLFFIWYFKQSDCWEWISEDFIFSRRCFKLIPHFKAFSYRFNMWILK